MQPNIRTTGKETVFFAKDGSGVATLCERSGDTHFLHVDPFRFEELLSRPTFSLGELVESLNLREHEEANQFAEQLLSLGIIDRIG